MTWEEQDLKEDFYSDVYDEENGYKPFCDDECIKEDEIETMFPNDEDGTEYEKYILKYL